MEPPKTIQTPAIHILLGNEKNGHVRDLRRYAKNGKDIEWTINSKARDGDIVAFYIKRPLSSFVAVGHVRGKPYLNTNKEWHEKCLAKIHGLQILREPLHYSIFKFGNWRFTPPQSSMTVKSKYRDALWDLLLRGNRNQEQPLRQSGSVFLSGSKRHSYKEKPSVIEKAIGGLEGGRQSVTVTRTERNPANRQACLRNWGYQCRVCGFDFGQTYGDNFKNFIHVHHHNPLAVTGAIVSDPVNDMSPLCPNCHAVAHLRKPIPYSITELIAFRSGGKKR